MAERDDTTDKKPSAAERKRIRARERRAQLIAEDPEWVKKEYRKKLAKNPNLNREEYRRNIERDPDHNKKKRERRRARLIASGECLPREIVSRQRKSKHELEESRKSRARARYRKDRHRKIAKVVQRQKERYESDILYATRCRLRGRMRSAVRSQSARKSCSYVELIGCSQHQLASHLESLFSDGMSWDNRSQWHIDHIIPVSSFDLTTAEGQKAAFHYTNLRPLWARDNQRKSSRPPVQQHRFSFGYVVLADKQREPGTEGRLGTERSRA